MSRFAAELAGPGDDAELRRILGEIPMDGDMRVSFHREPSFFIGEGLGNDYCRTITVRDTGTGRITGFGTRAIRKMYVNGDAREVGYLGALRVREEYRRSRALTTGYRLLRDLHGDGRVDLYLTTIAERNLEAVRLFNRRRKEIPAYHPFGRYRTFAVDLRRRSRAGSSGGIRVETGTGRQLGGIIDCLARNGREKQFYPVYTEGDFRDRTTPVLGLGAEDFSVARSGDSIVGVAAAWDQRSFKQARIAGYGGSLRLARPLYNAWSRLLRHSPLPSPGEELPVLYLACVAVDRNDPGIFSALLEHVHGLADRENFSHCLVGLHEKDRLCEAMPRYRPIEYRTLVYLVSYGGIPGGLESLESRTPYLELGTL